MGDRQNVAVVLEKRGAFLGHPLHDRRITRRRPELAGRAGRQERSSGAVAADAAWVLARRRRRGVVAAKHPEPLLLIEDSSQRLVEQRDRQVAVHNRGDQGTAECVGATRAARALEVIRDPGDVHRAGGRARLVVPRRIGARAPSLIERRRRPAEPTPRGRAQRIVGAEIAGLRRHLLVFALHDPGGAMRRRIVRPNESFGAPQVTQHVVEAQRLLAREMRLVERPGQRSLPRASERARLGQGRDRARQRRGGIAPNLVGAHRGRGPAVDETALIRRQVKLVQPLVGDVGVEVLVLAVVDDEVLHLGHRTRPCMPLICAATI